jgi:streptogramin lyase
MTTGNAIFLFDYETEEFTYYPVPSLLSMPVGIYLGSDGGIWFCEFLGGKIGRLDTETGEIKEYQLPLDMTTPTVMRAETEGKYLWFTGFVSNALGRINMYTGEIKVFPAPSILSFPTEDTVDDKGNIWFSTATQNTLNYLTPSTGEFTIIPQPGTLIAAPISVPPAVNIAVHYGPDNAIWFTDLLLNKVGRYQL